MYMMGCFGRRPDSRIDGTNQRWHPVRKLVTPVAAAAALVIVAFDATPAKAQVVFTSGYSSNGYYPSAGYSGGYSPYSYGGGGVTFGTYPAYSAHQGYGFSPSYAGVYNRYPAYRGGFGQSSGMGYGSYYGGGRPAYYGGGYTGGRGGSWGGWRR